MPRETTINVPTEDLDWVTEALTRAGLTVMDTGKRVTTDEDLDAEAVLSIGALEHVSESEASRVESLIRP